MLCTSIRATAIYYNAAGRHTEVWRGSTLIVRYAGNGLGERIANTVGSTTTHFHYDASGQLIEETKFDGTLLRSYLYLDNELIAMVDGPLNKRFTVHNDHLGTPLLVTDMSKTVWWQATYDPFGKATVSVEKVKLPLRFAGQYLDEETGFHYNYYRDYDPETGRYLQSDPIDLNGGINTYDYVGGNKVNYTVPKGLTKWMGHSEAAGLFAFSGVLWTFKSECFNWRRLIVTVMSLGVGPGPGPGVKGDGDHGMTISSFDSFYDGKNYFDPHQFNETFFTIGGSLAGGIGYGASRNHVGEVKFNDVGPQGGISVSVGLTLGLSALQDVQEIKCNTQCDEGG